MAQSQKNKCFITWGWESIRVCRLSENIYSWYAWLPSWIWFNPLRVFLRLWLRFILWTSSKILLDYSISQDRKSIVLWPNSASSHFSLPEFFFYLCTLCLILENSPVVKNLGEAKKKRGCLLWAAAESGAWFWWFEDNSGKYQSVWAGKRVPCYCLPGSLSFLNQDRPHRKNSFRNQQSHLIVWGTYMQTSPLGKESERSNSTLVLGICARHTQREVCCKNISHEGASNLSLFIGSSHMYLHNNSNNYSLVPPLHVHISYWLLSPPLLANQRNIKTTLIKNVNSYQNAKLRRELTKL